MVALFKDTINHALDGAGDRLNEAIILAGEQLDQRIKFASQELNETIKQASEELHNQRKLTKEDIQELVDYAATRFGQTLDERIEKVRNEASILVTQKIAQVRTELSEAANEQKRVAVRNASIAVVTSTAVGLLSLVYRKYLGGNLDLIDVFRSSMLALGVGYALWLLFKHAGAYFTSSRFKRNAVIVGLGYFDVLRPRGAIGQIVLLLFILGIWAFATFAPSLAALGMGAN